MHNHVIAHIGSTKLAKVDAGVLNGLYGQLLASGRRLPSRTGRGYSPEVVERALELRADGLTLARTAKELRVEFQEASHITKDTLASLLRRQGERRPVDDLPQGIRPPVVQERLGHSTIAITLGIYSHVSPTLHDQAAGQVAGLIL